MGLKGSGGYNSADYEFTRSFDDPEERNEAINAEIGRRISELGPFGIISLAGIKGSISMGNGTYALSDFLDDSPLKPCFLHSFLLYSSPQYDAYSGICCGIHLGILLLGVMSAIEKLIRAIKGAGGNTPFMAPHIAFFGIALFLLDVGNQRKVHHQLYSGTIYLRRLRPGIIGQDHKEFKSKTQISGTIKYQRVNLSFTKKTLCSKIKSKVDMPFKED